MAIHLTGSLAVSGSINAQSFLSANITGSLAVTGSAAFSYTYQANAWSAGGALITGRRELAGAGTQNAGLAFGGYSPITGSITLANPYGSYTLINLHCS